MKLGAYNNTVKSPKNLGLRGKKKKNSHPQRMVYDPRVRAAARAGKGGHPQERRAARGQKDKQMCSTPPPPCLPIRDSLAARLTQRFDGVLRSFLLFGAAARHQRGDGEGVGPGRKLGLGRCRELHGPQCAVLARDRACRTAVQLPQKRQRPKHRAKFPSAARGEPGTLDESAPVSQELHTGVSFPPPQVFSR